MAEQQQTFSHYPAWPAPMRVPLTVVPEDDCPYLPGRLARSRAFHVDGLPGEAYHDFMDSGFRRSGRVIYQPVCRGCRECRPIRVPVERFAPSKSQRRVARRNRDLLISVGPARATDEKFDVYARYMARWHRKTDESRAQFEMFLYDSPVRTIEFCYRDARGTLLAVGICDLCPRSLSSVYFYFDPAHARRSLGTFGVLAEIAHARSLRVPHYYLGYWISGCQKMRYKSAFAPNEILDTDGRWRESSPSSDAGRGARAAAATTTTAAEAVRRNEGA